MKNLFKYAMTMALPVLAFASCTDKYEYDGVGKWDATDGYQQVYFAKNSATVELDPTDATEASFQIYRHNSVSAATAKLDVVKNTDDVFVVGDAVFAAGDSVTTVNVSFPQAQVGKTYTLQVTVTDPNMVSQYSKDVLYTLNVTRVKWNDVGYYMDGTTKVEGWAMYTDIVCGSWFGGKNWTFPTRIQERDDMPGYFRLINTYDWHYPYNDPESPEGADWQGEGVTREDLFDYSTDHYIYIDATNPDEVVIPQRCGLGTDWGYGEFGIFSYAQYRLNNGGDPSGLFGTYKNGAITFPDGSILRSMANYNDGGLYVASGVFKVVLDPSLDLYTAKVGDYGWEPVFEGQFISEKLDMEKDGIALYKGVRNDSIETANEGCYDRFEKANGVPYLIASPYTNGKNLIFTVNKEGKIVVPAGFESQATGLEALNEDVYAQINGGSSLFSEREIILNITFQNAKGTVEYGTTNESLAYVVWNKVGMGAYTYNTGFMCEEDEEGNLIPVTDDPAELFQREDKPNIFKLSPWGDGTEFVFTWDQATNKCTVPMQPEGYVHPSYGIVYVSDIAIWQDNAGLYENYPCYYDPESTTFIFSTAYYVEAGAFGYGTEALKVTWDAAAARSKAGVASAKKVKKHFNLNKGMKKANRFIGKKVNRKAIINESNLVK